MDTTITNSFNDPKIQFLEADLPRPQANQLITKEGRYNSTVAMSVLIAMSVFIRPRPNNFKSDVEQTGLFQRMQSN
jgi:hypothetical protein